MAAGRHKTRGGAWGRVVDAFEGSGLVVGWLEDTYDDIVGYGGGAVFGVRYILFIEVYQCVIRVMDIMYAPVVGPCVRSNGTIKPHAGGAARLRGGLAPGRRVDARVSASRVDDAGADSDDGIVQGGR